MKIYSNDPKLKEIALAGFPDYNGKKFSLSITDRPVDLKSYWDGGSRSYFAVVKLATMEVVEVPQNGHLQSKQVINNTLFPCDGFAVVQNSIYRGKDMGVTVHIHPDNANKVAIEDLSDKITWPEKVVLSATRGLKSSYGGVKNYRFKEAQSITGITEEEYEKAKSDLIQRKLLNAAGAITPEGRNAIGQKTLYALKRGQEYS